MNLQNLPPELLGRIFQYAARNRDPKHCLKRFLRMRFVSRMFRDFVDDTIFRLRLLHGADYLADYMAHYYRGIEVDKPAHPEWYSYVINYLARHAWYTQERNTVLAQIRRCAVAISELAGDAEQSAVTARLQSLFRLVLGRTMAERHAHELLWTAELASRKDPPSDIEDDMLVTAAYLGYLPLVEKAISEGRQCSPGGEVPEVSSHIFGSIYDAAVVGGDMSMMRLLLSSSADYKPGGPLPLKIRYSTLRDSALSGNWDAYDFALGSEPLPIEKGRRPLEYFRVLRTPDQYKRTVASLGGISRESEVALLGAVTRLGHTEMTKHLLLSQGPAELNELRDKDTLCGYMGTTALKSAVEFGDLEIVNLILKHGADPNIHHITRTPLMAAAKLGRTAVAEALIAAGAEVDVGSPPPIVIAVLKEDMDMFRLLRRRGATLDTPESGAWAMAMARLHGLESMAEVLEREGVEREVTLYRGYRPGEEHGDMFIYEETDYEDDDD